MDKPKGKVSAIVTAIVMWILVAMVFAPVLLVWFKGMRALWMWALQ